jgi:dTDP-4-amino-4,6-dideoxygalactose transaminase
MERINVTKTFLPPIDEYEEYVRQIWDRDQLTNQGPLVLELESKMRDYLKVDNFHFVTNGTLALQVALKALGITEGEIITTPFSYVATTSSILWEHCTPVFVDIEPNAFSMDANKIEAAITDKTKAIMPVHVFGFACDIERIDAIAKKHGLKVIYDAAHAFGVTYKGRSLLSYGDISICSFHSTKLFHTIEGGCVITKDSAVSDRVDVIKRFGHTGDEHFTLGLNAKASEFQAAMGLCNLKYVKELIDKRQKVSELYNELLGKQFNRPTPSEHTKYNYAYYPILLESENQLLKVSADLAEENIFPRRYFYPSLNTLPYLDDKQSCPVSEDIADRILCLPLYADLQDEVVKKICSILIR